MEESKASSEIADQDLEEAVGGTVAVAKPGSASPTLPVLKADADTQSGLAANLKA